MISRHDIAMDGQISFTEFKKIFEASEEVSNVGLTKQDSLYRPIIAPITPMLPTEKKPLMAKQTSQNMGSLKEMASAGDQSAVEEIIESERDP